MLELFLLMLAAHLCGDVLIYSPGLAQSKRSGTLAYRSKFTLRHVLIHAFLVWIWLWPYAWRLQIAAAAYILIVHFAIDISRTYYENLLIEKKNFHIFQRKDIFRWLTGKSINRESKEFLRKYLKRWLGINFLDQGLHLASILVFVCIWSC